MEYRDILMRRFKRVGVVLSLQSIDNIMLEHAEELARINQATVYFICVVKQELSVEKKDSIRSFIQQKFKFDFHIAYLIGNSVVEITRYSDREKLDILLIQPESEHNKINKFFHGSLVLSLLRKAPCPVWVVKKPVNKSYNRVLIAVDAEEEDADYKLNDKLIEIGTSYAKRQSAECYLVTAWSLENEEILQGPFINMSEEKINTLKMECKITCAKKFENLQHRHSSILKGCSTKMLHGEPGYTIAEFANKNKIDVIIMGTLARKGIQGFLIGNTAETVINQINCSVIAIKPDGFISPIIT